MSIIKKALPLALIPASLYALNYFLFNRKFTPPETDNGTAAVQTAKCKNITYLTENGLPYPTHINHTSHPTLSLDGQWQFRIDQRDEGIAQKWHQQEFISGNSRLMNVPGCFNTAESALRDYEGTVWYQTVFTLSPEMVAPANWLRLAFGGSAYTTRVWLNGRLLGSSENGYAPFFFDITGNAFADKPNTLTVMVSNKLNYDSLPPMHYDNFRLGWHCYGGIHKSVTIESIPNTYCFKLNPVTSFTAKAGTVKVRALFHRRGHGGEEGRGTAPASATGKPNEVPLKITVKDPSGKECAASEASLKIGTSSVSGIVSTVKIPAPHLWSARNPNLYTLTLKTPCEELQVNFGFRTVTVEDSQIKINGHQMIFKGVSRHEENVEDGLAQKPDSINKEMQLIKETGGNYVRLAHYPHSPAALDYSDKEGLYIWTEIPLYQAGVGFPKLMLQKTRQDKKNKFFRNLPVSIGLMDQLCRPKLLQNAREHLLKLVERHINHPSVIFWGLGNECWTCNPAGAEALKWLKEQVLQLDRSRLITYAALSAPVLTENFERSFEVVDVIALNEYYGWYYGKTEQTERFVEAIHRKYPDKPILISETGADCVYGEHDNGIPPEKGYSEEYQRHLLKTKWKILREKPWFSGWSIWVLKDFLCMEYLEENPIPYYNLKGLIDREYREKQSYHLLKSIYAEKDEV